MDINKKLEMKINGKLFKARKNSLRDGFKKGKVVNEVLDKPTVMTLYKMITGNVIAYVNGAVSAGKESLLFWAVGEDSSDIALKIYLVSTSNFKKREAYMAGDPRFARMRKGTKNIIHLWAKKEFRNLLQCHDNDILVPRPIFQANNVLAMSFVGNDGSPSPLLLESEIDENDYHQAKSILKQMYTKARLVHADFSEFNLFKTRKGLVVFDLGSAVDLRHPNATEFLKRDISNMARFFSKRGVTVEDPAKIFEDIVK